MASLSNIITPTNVLTASSTNTLTNKTINASNNTVTNVSLSTGVTGTLPVANGGTGASSLSSAGILTTAAAVTVAQGGTGATSLTANNVLLGNGTSAVQVVAPGSNGNVLTSNGTTWTSAAASTGALTLLATSTVSGTPQNVDITWTGTTYDDYLIIAENFSCPNTHRYAFRLANSSGTFQTGADYYSSGIKWEGSASSVRQTANSYIEPIANNSGAVSEVDGVGFFYVTNANTSTALAAKVTFNWTQVSTSGSLIQGTSSGAFCLNLSTGIRGFRIFDASGNGLGTGTLRLYGIAK